MPMCLSRITEAESKERRQDCRDTEVLGVMPALSVSYVYREAELATDRRDGKVMVPSACDSFLSPV